MRGDRMQLTPEFVSTPDTVLPVPLATTCWRPHSHLVLSPNPSGQNIINQIFGQIVRETKSAYDQKDSISKAHPFLFFNKVRQFNQSRSATAAKPFEFILLARRHGITEQEAFDLNARCDRAWRRYVKTHFNADDRAPHVCDLVITTAIRRRDSSNQR